MCIFRPPCPPPPNNRQIDLKFWRNIFRGSSRGVLTRQKHDLQKLGCCVSFDKVGFEILFISDKLLHGVNCDIIIWILWLTKFEINIVYNAVWNWGTFFCFCASLGMMNVVRSVSNLPDRILKCWTFFCYASALQILAGLLNHKSIILNTVSSLGKYIVKTFAILSHGSKCSKLWLNCLSKCQAL